ncbi:hypothetical protein GETHLI_28130 [Geothrix limicola]|uniref:STAS domain-containing protein n=1 Tax=Geothrix limicola TaxID=2927978 RepID=A0ABQ5QID2_9BACT|nr:hypothetical protein [Geothrix limicola]GLH74311.1 hypothetical protein GETHLI_28130 [Geothrix limicola]
MFTVSSDPDRNRLYITLSGYLEGPERQEVTKAVMAEAAKLAPGFDVITDITGLHATNKDGLKDFLRAKSALKLRGAGHTIRVTRIPLSRIQLQRITEEAGYQQDHADSLEEADRMLDALRADRRVRADIGS